MSFNRVWLLDSLQWSVLLCLACAGDLGYIDSVDRASGSLTVRYPPRGSSSAQGLAYHLVKYERSDVNEQLQLAWAITVHKVRGATPA